MHQPAEDQIAYSDNGWLRHEIAEQQDELVRAREVVAELDVEHKALVRKAYGGAAGSGGAQSSKSPAAGAVADGLTALSLAGRESSGNGLRSNGGSPTKGWQPQSRPTTRQGGSRPSSRQQSARPGTGARGKSGRPMSRSGFRAAATIDPQELEAMLASKSPAEVIGALRVFPAMAKSGEGARISGMRKKRAETSSLFPLPQVTGRGQAV